MRLWHLALPFSIYLKRVTGNRKLPAMPCIIAANHEGPLDHELLLCVFRRTIRFIAAGHLRHFRNPLWLYNRIVLFWIARCIPSGDGALEKSRQALARGEVLGIYPEGDIHPRWRRDRTRTGAIVLSHQLQIPILPVAIKGSKRIWPITGPLRWWRIRSAEVAIGTPIPPPPPNPLSQEQYQALSDALMEKILSLQQTAPVLASLPRS